MCSLRGGASVRCRRCSHDLQANRYAEEVKSVLLNKSKIISAAHKTQSPSGRINLHVNLECECGRYFISTAENLRRNPDASCDICFRLKGALKSNKIVVEKHWATGKDVYCQGGYEHKVVCYLNLNQINYIWQPTTFRTSYGNYTPDFFWVDKGVFVEIKGYFRELARNKFDECSKIVDIVLWDASVLKLMGILK